MSKERPSQEENLQPESHFEGVGPPDPIQAFITQENSSRPVLEIRLAGDIESLSEQQIADIGSSVGEALTHYRERLSPLLSKWLQKRNNPDPTP